MADIAKEIELVFEPQDEGGYHVYAPDLPGMHTQRDDVEEALTNATEAVALYVEGLREEGESLEASSRHFARTVGRSFASAEVMSV